MNQTTAKPTIHCALCLSPAKLSRSHILPRFFSEGSERLLPTGDSGKLQPFTDAVSANPAIKLGRRQKGVWDSKLGMVQHLLCVDCELRLSKLEDYFRRFFYGTSSPIRIQLPFKDPPIYHADYAKLKLFQLSLLWRLHAAKGMIGETVDLGEKHGERIRRMLLSDTPGAEHEYTCTMVRLVSTPELELLQKELNFSLEQFKFAPIAKRLEHGRVYGFVAGGFSWAYSITSAKVPELLQNSYLRQNGEFWLLSSNPTQFLSHFSKKVAKTGNYPAPLNWGIKPKPIIGDFTIL